MLETGRNNIGKKGYYAWDIFELRGLFFQFARGGTGENIFVRKRLFDGVSLC